MNHIITNDGEEYWINKKYQYHRVDGGPAIVTKNGSETWYKKDYIHRENGPNYIHVSGIMNLNMKNGTVRGIYDAGVRKIV